MAILLAEGESGCREAVERDAIAVVVDALRTSATLPWLFERGAAAVIVASSLNDVHSLREVYPKAVLAGEHGGAPIPGFDLGNSPSEIKGLEPSAIRSATVIFSSSAGSRRLVEISEAPEVYVGAPVNARRLCRHLTARVAETGRDVVLVAAGHPERVSTPEDTWAAVYLASLLGPDLAPESKSIYDRYIDDVLQTGLFKLYKGSGNAKRLRKLGFREDVKMSAQRNTCRSVPHGVERIEVSGGGHALRLEAADLSDLWLRARWH